MMTSDCCASVMMVTSDRCKERRQQMQGRKIAVRCSSYHGLLTAWMIGLGLGGCEGARATRPTAPVSWCGVGGVCGCW
jgi:hypothetical protein